ncbi:lytic transglycosylase domain-containing protein [Hyphococcus sp.]|uniref:lytic transglycosylase domain-containing protein n=1 Tax=Hyphococcus sp. TaxID=2038636 RepID=UPI002085D93F|nr:MAG: lytic transglycosylase [Marinicaulis sp.]
MAACRWFVVLLALVVQGFGFAFAQETTAPSDPDEAGPVLRVLSEQDAALYKDIFDLQEDGRWQAADVKIAALEDDILLGYVQYQRYMHPTAYRSSFNELKRWMSYYADHPEADKIYSLARKRQPKGQSSPVRPIPRKWRASPDPEFSPEMEEDYENTNLSRLRQIEGRVRYLANKERALDAKREIDAHVKNGTITERQYDRMRSWIAASLYYQGYVDAADEMASDASARNGDSAVLAYWIAGLIKFRKGDVASAHDLFRAMAAVPYQADSLRSAAGFWAARTALGAGNPAEVTPNLEIAARYPFTFYGQLALAQLGRSYDYNWSAPSLTQAQFDNLVADEPRIKRAIALAEAGQTTEADLELRWANGSIDQKQIPQLLAVAIAMDFPAAQIDIALSDNDPALQAGLFPIPHYAPENGFKVDRALLYALMRQESKFKTDATSRVGARGLMQLMPRTASYIAKDRSLRNRSGRERLYDPAYNMELGQTYVGYLIDGAADGDLFNLAAAYNGGPGNLRRWKRDVEIEDPLLFIESIPNRESRDFVEKVLTNFWVYRARLGQPAPSREKVAAGELPLYEAIDQIADQSGQ